MEAATQGVLATNLAPLADSAQLSQRYQKGKNVLGAPSAYPRFRPPSQEGRANFKLTQNYCPPLFSSSSFPPLAASMMRNNRGSPPLQAGYVGLTVSKAEQQSATSTALMRNDSPAQGSLQTSPPNLSKSYREAVAGSKKPALDLPRERASPDVSFSSVKHNPLASHQGEPALLLSKEEVEKRAHPFRLTLVGKFSNGKPPMAAIRKGIQVASFAGEVLVGLLDYRHVFFKFEKEDDFHTMWSRRAWMFSGFQARIFRWSPGFRTDIESSVAPVWIRLPQLPLHCCDKESLYSIASAFGNPLKVDRATAEAHKIIRPSEARVLVEMDVLQPHPHRVWIGSQEEGRWQHVELEDLPHYCTNCCKMGHQAINCKPPNPKRKREVGNIRKGKEKMWVPVGAGNTNLAIVPSSAPFCGKEKMDRFMSNLGQLLKFFSSQEEGRKENDQPSIASTDNQNENATTPVMMQAYETQKHHVEMNSECSSNAPQFMVQNLAKDSYIPKVSAPLVMDWETVYHKVSGYGSSNIVGHMELLNQVTKTDSLLEQSLIVGVNEKPEEVLSLNDSVLIGNNVAVEQVSCDVSSSLEKGDQNSRLKACPNNVEPLQLVPHEFVNCVLDDGLIMEQAAGDKVIGNLAEVLNGKEVSSTSTQLAAGLDIKSDGWSDPKGIKVVSSHPAAGLQRVLAEVEFEDNDEEAVPVAGLLRSQEKGGKGNVQPLSASIDDNASTQEISVPISWEEGEISNKSKDMVMSEIRWNQGNFSSPRVTQVQPPSDKIGKVSNTIFQFSKSDLEILSKLNTSKVNIGWEEGESSSIYRVKPTSDFVSESEYAGDDDGFDRWTENSYDEEPDDVFSQFLSKMEKSRAAPAEFALNRQNLEDDKNRKYGMSDRVLRSMLRASNSDPSRPGSS